MARCRSELIDPPLNTTSTSRYCSGQVWSQSGRSLQISLVLANAAIVQVVTTKNDKFSLVLVALWHYVHTNTSKL